MSRRRKQGGAEALIGLVAMLPWWAGLLLAMASFIVFRALAVAPDATAMQPGRIGDFLSDALIYNLARILQYVAPIVCLVGAGVSLWRRKRRDSLLAVAATASSASEAVAGMSWRDFELLVGAGFRQKGFEVTELGGSGPDGGVDLVLRKGGEQFLVQCKHWKAFNVGVDVVRQLYGVMAARGAAGGFVVTAGAFTADAMEFASGRNITLVGGPELNELVRSTSSSAAPGTRTISPVVRSDTEVPITCPTCRAPMTRRKARRGTNAGSEFWGCTRYPTCKGTR